MSDEKTEVCDSLSACLCCACGTVSFESAWTYWQWADDEAPGWNGDQWRPSLPGEGDPMMLCPACKWEHRDTDDGSGVYQGTLAEMEAQREADRPDMGESWAHALAGAANARYLERLP